MSAAIFLLIVALNGITVSGILLTGAIDYFFPDPVYLSCNVEGDWVRHNRIYSPFCYCRNGSKVCDEVTSRQKNCYFYAIWFTHLSNINGECICVNGKVQCGSRRTVDCTLGGKLTKFGQKINKHCICMYGIPKCDQTYRYLDSSGQQFSV